MLNLLRVPAPSLPPSHAPPTLDQLAQLSSMMDTRSSANGPLPISPSVARGPQQRSERGSRKENKAKGPIGDQGLPDLYVDLEDQDAPDSAPNRQGPASIGAGDSTEESVVMASNAREYTSMSSVPDGRTDPHALRTPEGRRAEPILTWGSSSNVNYLSVV